MSKIDVSNMDLYYGDFHALKNINLSIDANEVTAFIGPSGCGKTTTLRMISGFEMPSSGTIKVQGERVDKKEPYQRDVNTVFQNYALFPNMNVYDNVAYGLRVKKVPKNEIKERVLEALKMVQLEGFEKRRITQMSGGQKQRVAIARAIINRPKVLLLDEPLGALDLKLRKQMQIELKRLQKKLGITFVYVTHDQEEALTMSDRIAIINQGRIEQLAAPKDIYEHPKTKFVASFIGETNLLDAMVLSIDGDKAVIGTEVGKATVMIDPKKKIKVSDGVAVSIRPENMKFSKTPVEGFSIKGVVKEQIFVGNLIKMMITLNDGTEIRINRFDADDLAENGELLYLYWDLQKGVVIKEKNLVDTDSVRDIEGGDPDEEE